MKYTEDHEWARAEGDAYRVGITDYAQQQLGDIVYVELPAVGDEVTAGAEAAVVESVKAAGDVKSPLTGVVTEVNAALADAPETVNDDPEGGGWFYQMRAT
ncbi:MAG: glycine cleavage system protein GcvH, partial [Gammaproteobacteria bacterium]|nr:glycine cleavage system protein GcvH [Gammaproteobacteria bacterium]